MASEFGAALRRADLAVAVGIYSRRARPEDFPGVSIEQIAEAAADGALCMPDLDSAEGYLGEELRAGDLCVTLGSGDIGRLARRLVATGQTRA